MLRLRRRLVLLLLAAASMSTAPLAAQELIHFLQGDGERFGASVSGLRDVDGDSVDDLIVSQTFSASAVSVLSGADGSIIHSSALFSSPERVSRAGDVDADGTEDYMASDERWRSIGGDLVGMVAIWSGADGTLLRTLVGTRPNGLFGESIAPAGDVNLDGHDDILVGSSGFVHYVNNFAQIYSGADGSVLLEVFGSSSFADRFGWVVAGLGDLDLDGTPDFMVSAKLAGAHRQGAVTVFSGRTGAVLHQVDGSATGESFGRTLRGTGDLDLDGIPDFAVGFIERFAVDQGKVTVYSGADATPQFTLEARPGFGHIVSFGDALDASGDFDGDGRRDLLVGNTQSAANGYSSGEAYVFSGADGALLARFYGSRPNWFLGGAVAFAGNVNGDGLDDVVVGAHWVDEPYEDAGAVIVYAGGAPPLLLECPAIRRENGSDVRAQVSRATPFATVYLAGSPLGLGATNLPQYQVTLGVHRARIVTSTTADAQGMASFTSRIPPRFYGTTAWLQAFEQARTSNWIERAVLQPWYW